MSNDVQSTFEVNNDIVCEALGCQSRATKDVIVKLEPKGTIVLFLCDNCKLKFCADHRNYSKSNLEGASR